MHTPHESSGEYCALDSFVDFGTIYTIGWSDVTYMWSPFCRSTRRTVCS